MSQLEIPDWIEFIKEHEPSYPVLDLSTPRAQAHARSVKGKKTTPRKATTREGGHEHSETKELKRVNSSLSNHPSRNKQKLPDWQFCDGWFARPQPFSPDIMSIVEDDIERFSLHTRSQSTRGWLHKKKPHVAASRKMDYEVPGKDSPGPIYYTRSELSISDRKASFGFGQRSSLASNASPGPVYFPNTTSQRSRPRTTSLNAGGRHLRNGLYDPDLIGEGAGKYYYPSENQSSVYSPIRRKRPQPSPSSARQYRVQNTDQKPSVSVLAIMHEMDARLPPPSVSAFVAQPDEVSS